MQVNARDVANELKALQTDEIHGFIRLNPTLRDRAVKALGGADRPQTSETPTDTPTPAPETNTPEWRDTHPVLSDDRKTVDDPRITTRGSKQDTVPKAVRAKSKPAKK